MSEMLKFRTLLFKKDDKKRNNLVFGKSLIGNILLLYNMWVENPHNRIIV